MTQSTAITRARQPAGMRGPGGRRSLSQAGARPTTGARSSRYQRARAAIPIGRSTTGTPGREWLRSLGTPGGTKDGRSGTTLPTTRAAAGNGERRNGRIAAA